MDKKAACPSKKRKGNEVGFKFLNVIYIQRGFSDFHFLPGPSKSDNDGQEGHVPQQEAE